MTEAIVLKTTEFRDTDQIATLFTSENGILRAIVKGAHRRTKYSSRCSLSPLACIDCVYTQGRGDLMRLDEVSIINNFLHLRTSLPLLETGCLLIQLIEKTQFPGKEARPLYQLLKYYLEKLSVHNMDSLAASFRLKLLKHEGQLIISDSCGECHAPLEEAAIAQGECLCSQHARSPSLSFSAIERLKLYCLANGRSLKDIETIEGDELFWNKIKKLYDFI